MVRHGCGTTRTLMLAALAALAGCTRSDSPTSPTQQAESPLPPPEVLVDLPTAGQIVDYEDFTGRTVATRNVEIRARVTGYVDKINFRELEGRDVEKGAVLYEIDARPYKAEVARAKANLLQAESHAKRLDLDYRRAQRLVESKAITIEQYDAIAGDRAEAQAAIAIAQANVDLAELNVGFTKVLAPISGRIGRTMVDAGNVVKADDTLLTTIVQIDPIYVYFEVDERSLLRIRRYLEEGRIKTNDGTGVRVMMGLADEDQHPHIGYVNFLDNRLDPGTGTLQVRGVFANKDRMLRPGLFVRVRLPVGEPYRALLVAEEALGTDQGQKFVYIVDQDNRAQYRRIETGKLQDGRRVVVKGLAEGERVVVSGLQRVRPGELVQPKQIDTAHRDATPDAASATLADAPLTPAASPGQEANRIDTPSEEPRQPPRKQAASGGHAPVAR